MNLDTQPWAYVHEECGGITDLTTSFFQVPLPAHLRPLFSLKAKDGTTFQLTVLPMGLAVSPEVTQMVTPTLAGHPL